MPQVHGVGEPPEVGDRGGGKPPVATLLHVGTPRSKSLSSRRRPSAAVAVRAVGPPGPPSVASPQASPRPRQPSGPSACG